MTYVALDLEVDHVTLFDTREVEFTTYGISCAPNTETAQDKVNRPFGPCHDHVNKVISHEPKVADPDIFGELYKRFKKQL